MNQQHERQDFAENGRALTGALTLAIGALSAVRRRLRLPRSDHHSSEPRPEQSSLGAGSAQSRTAVSAAPPDEPALASVRLANGGTGYVELSLAKLAGRQRVRELREGTNLQFNSADVVERHRHPHGIKWMSLNRLMRLRDEERAREHTTDT